MAAMQSTLSLLSSYMPSSLSSSPAHGLVIAHMALRFPSHVPSSTRVSACHLPPPACHHGRSPHVEKLGEDISKLTLENTKHLVGYLQLGIIAAVFAPVAFANPAGVVDVGDAGSVAAVEEKTKFDVVIKDVPRSARISTIKVVQVITNLALKEAKELIDWLLKKFKEVMSKEEAEDAKKQLEEGRAKVSIA